MSISKDEKRLVAELAKLGGGLDASSDLTFEGKKYIAPETSDVVRARKYYERKEEELMSPFSFSRVFPFRPWDGAHAFKAVCEKYFGGAIGEATQSFFGSSPPEMIEIDTGWRERDTVPWGKVSIPALGEDTEIYLSSSGADFSIYAEGLKKDEPAIRGLFKLVEQELMENSIYRGQAISLDDRGRIAFENPNAVNRDEVVYSAETLAALDAELWWMIRNTEEAKADGIDMKRTVLLEGPYGTGKTIATNLTASECVQAGWTCIVLRPGTNLNDGLNLAKQYGPAVLIIEDIDTSGQQDSMGLSNLLDVFDGFSTKDSEIMVLATTNHADRIPKGMLRPGRISSIVHVGPIDMAGMRKFAEIVIPDTLLDPEDVDWPKVWESFKDYLPAFIKEGMTKALLYARARGADTVGTDDLCLAGDSLRKQWDLMQDADEGLVAPGLVPELSKLVSNVINGTEILDIDGDYEGELKAS